MVALIPSLCQVLAGSAVRVGAQTLTPTQIDGCRRLHWIYTPSNGGCESAL